MTRGHIAVDLWGVSKTYSSQAVFSNLSLSIAAGTVTCILGPSGCGKTTLLRIIAGLTLPDDGMIDTADSTGEPIGMVFQEPRLLPWKSAIANVSYVLEGSVARPGPMQQAKRLLELVEVDQAADRFPQQLSGGMARRVALARALAAPSRLLLFDEAFASLDIELKHRLARRVREHVRANRQTLLCVTHDLKTATALADRIILFSTAPASILEDLLVPSDHRVGSAGANVAEATFSARAFQRIEEVLAWEASSDE